MNAKERILAVLNRSPVDRPPVDVWYTPEVGASLKAHFGESEDLALWKAMGVDKIVWAFMNYKGASGEVTGSQVGAGAENAITRTMWGVPLKAIESGEAHYEEFGEAPMQDMETEAEVDAYEFWPDPDRFDYDAADQLAREAAKDFAVIGPWGSFFEIYCQLRGLEQAMMDLVLDPDLIDVILDRVEAVQTEMMKRYFARSADVLDLVFISDDIAGQSNILMSPASWERHLQPRMQRWCQLVHDHGLKVFYHTDGAADRLIQPLIDCGIDVLNPIQHVCPGMEPAGLKERYGDQIIFHGGVDNQKILPFGSPEEVRKEVRMLQETLGRDGGYICSSCHNIQAGTPVENILAMVEKARRASS